MWKNFNCLETELNCKIVLACGQSFRWKQDVQNPSIWFGVLNNNLWYLKQIDGKLHYKTFSDEKCIIPYTLKSGKVLCNAGASLKSEKVLPSDTEELFLRDYFQLDVNIPELYEKWSSVDEKFSQLRNNFCGIRMLRQNPVENLFSFICSQNNNIKRISQLVTKLCENYGRTIAEDDNGVHYTFPSISALAKPGVEEKLRTLGFGYRAKFIYQSAKYIESNCGGEQWLYSLREKTYEEARGELLALPGVGAKVADCVCLMSLDKRNAIPIDTHMWQVAVRDYLPHLQKNKTVTDKAYKEIGDFFRHMYGEYAGWGHSVLFSADLKRFEALNKPNSDAKRKTKSGVKHKSKKKKVK